MWPPLSRGWNPASEMDESHIRPRIASLLFPFPCCCGFDDECPFIRPSWLQKFRRSNPRVDSVDTDSQNWWRKGWNSLRHAGEWSESVSDDAGSCCSGPRWKQLIRRFKTDGKNICGCKPSRFRYDLLSYELNFDHGSRLDDDHQLQNSSLSAVYPGQAAGTP